MQDLTGAWCLPSCWPPQELVRALPLLLYSIHPGECQSFISTSDLRRQDNTARGSDSRHKEGIAEQAISYQDSVAIV